MASGKPLPHWAHEETCKKFPLALQGDAKAIVAAFDWNKAPRGPEFWRDTYRDAARGFMRSETKSVLDTMARELFGARIKDAAE